MYKIGVFGGTFDPPHLGHLAVARGCIDAKVVDEVWFTLAVDPWQKKDRHISPYPHRLRMLQALVEGVDKIKINQIEAELGESITFTTLKELSAAHDDSQFVPIIGSDLIQSLPTWRNIAELVAEYEFIVATRPGHATETFDGLRITVVETPGLHISSSDMRHRLNNGESIECLTSEAVQDVIAELELFQP